MRPPRAKKKTAPNCPLFGGRSLRDLDAPEDGALRREFRVRPMRIRGQFGTWLGAIESWLVRHARNALLRAESKCESRHRGLAIQFQQNRRLREPPNCPIESKACVRTFCGL